MEGKRKTLEEACDYFGYDPDEVRKGKWYLFPADEFMTKLGEFYSMARGEKLARKKSRIIVDHDPRFPFALMQINAEKAIYLSSEQGQRLCEAEARLEEGLCHEELFGHTGLDQGIREALGYPE